MVCGTCQKCGGTTRALCAAFPDHGHVWCECVTKKGALPISVIIPHLSSREQFLRTDCLPTVEANRPAEILVIPGDKDGAQRARNEGAAQATQPFLFHCDDDVRLGDGCLQKMYDALMRNPAAGFAYSDHDIQDNRVMARTACKAGPFNPTRLRTTSYISTMSLMRHEIFRPWDLSIRRMQDWDFWLTVVERGVHGVYVPETLFTMHVIDKNISATWTAADWQRVVREKHGIPEPT